MGKGRTSAQHTECSPSRLINEYHQHHPAQVIGYNDISQDHKGGGVFNAGLPQGLTFTQDKVRRFFTSPLPSFVHTTGTAPATF